MAHTRLGVLDGMRGIAVLLVLWYHVWEISWLPAPLPALQFVPETGFAGVDVFFYISGFVIVYPFVRALAEGTASPSWGHFAYRRAVKILPSYLLSIAVLVALGYAHFSSPAQAVRDLVTHLLFIHTWWPDTYGSINGVLWTLAVEVEFYALFPLIWHFFRRSPYGTALAMICAAFAFRSYAQSCCVHTWAGMMIDNLPGYLDTFAFGMISAHLYVLLHRRCAGPRERIAATLGAIAGCICVIALLQNLWSVRALPDWSTIWQIQNRTLLGAALMAAALGSLLAAPVWQRALSNRVLLFFAAISYNLYLYHQAIARELFAWHLPPYHGDPHRDVQWQIAFTLVACAVSIAVAALVTYAFERPLLHIAARAARKPSEAETSGALPVA